MSERMSRRERRTLQRSMRKSAQDDRCKDMQPGDWVRFRVYEDEQCCYVDHAGKLARIKCWDDDGGHNASRAPRNKKVIVEIEPHKDENSIELSTTLKEFMPISHMELIARAAQ